VPSLPANWWGKFNLKVAMNAEGLQLNNGSNSEIMRRIQYALEAAVDSIRSFIPGEVKAEFKSGDDPVTEADRTINRILRSALVRDGEGWLSEESVDDLARLKKERVWVVDPLDGTREFVNGTPEWSISVAFVENGRAVAGGVCNPATGELFLGAIGHGISLNGSPVRPSDRKSLVGGVVLASRSEVKRGEWNCFRQAPFMTRPMGSVAYKLALVAAGLADATWTLIPKNEWDIAAGTALVECAGGFVRYPDNTPLVFNRRSTLLPGLFACGPYLLEQVSAVLESSANVITRTERSISPRQGIVS
jgi:myo-inositol-1(or 4)-monophosphatase